MHQYEMALERTRERRDTGIRRAADHAGSDWQRRARGYLLEWLSRAPGTFLAEDWREWATHRGLDSPPDGRAFGSVLQSAAKDGLIVKVGYAPARSSNLSPKVQWRAAR